MQLVWMLLLTFVFSFSAHAATVTTVKGKGVVISLDGETVEKGQKVELFDSNGKKRGVIQINKLNKSGTKAAGKLIVGKAQKGWTTDANSDATASSSSSYDSNKKLRYGGIIGFSMDDMTVSLAANGDVDLSGTGYGVKGAFDFSLSEKFQLRGRGGVEFFSASGDSAGVSALECTNCEVDITYVTLEGMGQFYLSKSKYSFWIGGGGALAHPASGSSNAIDTDSLSTTSAIQVGGGFDIKTTSGYVPIEILYSLLPESDSVSATYLTISAGYMW
jgi:hypothetical protein